MPTLNIGGKRVKVDDSFLSLTPEQQSATVDEIASSFEPAESQQMTDARGELSRITQGFEQRGDSSFRNVDSFMRGAADMFTFGNADEISALGQATVDAMRGNPNQYDRRLNQERIAQEIRDQRDPVASTAGRLTGAVGSGLGMAKAGLTFSGNLGAKAGLGARTAAAAKDGAVFGGGYGFGSGEGLPDRVGDAAGGAVMGGVIGGAIPPVVAGVKGIAKPFTDAISARTNPGGFAARKVSERLSASNMTPDTVANKMAANPGSAMADVAGKSARDLLRTAVNIPGPAKDRVFKQVTMRQFGQGDRLKTAIGRTFADPDGYLSAKDDLAALAKSQSAPLYARAYARPVHFSQELEDILKTPAGRSALQKAEQLAANEQQPFKQVFININNQAKRVPDTRGWDYIKRAMDDMIEGQTDDITRKVTNEGRILVGLKNRMLAEIDRYNPDYKAARGVFSGVAQIDEALEFGRKSLSMSPEAVRREIAKMSGTQKEAARVGAAEELRKAIDGAGFTNNAVLKIFNSRQRVQNIRSLFDNDRQFAEAIPPVVAGVKGIAKPFTDAISARTNPGGFAARKVSERLSASNMTPDTVANKMAANPGSAMADVAGKSARDLLRTAVNIPGPAKDRVFKQVTMRQFGQGDNIRSLFDNDRQFAEFRKTIFQEARKRSTYEAVKGNSTTASQLADMFESGGTSQNVGTLVTAATQGPITATIQWVGSALRRLGGLTPKVADEIAKRLMSASPQEVRAIVTELAKIEKMQIDKAAKSALVQQLVSRVLTSQTVGVISQNR